HRGRNALRKRVVALRHAARHLKIDALVVERLPGNQLRDDRAPFGRRVRVGKADAVEAALQSREMLRQTERPAAVHRNELVDAVAVDETAIEDGNLRVFDGQEHAIEVDDHRVNHNRIVSHPRPKTLAAGTSVSATIGSSASILPSSPTFTVPTR